MNLDPVPGTSFLADIQQGIRDVRNVVRSVQGLLTPDTFGPLVGRVLEREFRFSLLLEGFEMEPEVRSHFSYAREGFYLDTPFHNAKGVTRISIRGMTHWSAKIINGVPVDGDAAIKEFQEMIQDYFFPIGGATTADYELYLFDFRAPISGDDPFGEFRWLVHPVRRGPRVQHDKQRPFMRTFTFECLGLRSNRDEAKAEDGFLASLFSRGFLANLLNSIGLGSVVDVITGVFGVVDEFKGLLTDLSNVIAAAVDYVNGVQEFIQESIGKVRGLIAGVQEIVGRIENGIDLVEQLPGLVGSEFDSLKEQIRLGWPGMSSGDSSVGTNATNALRDVQDFLLTLSAQPQSFQQPLGNSPVANLRLQIEPGFTIETISQRTNVDIPTLIDANGLRFPFVDGRPRQERQVAAAQAKVAAAQADLSVMIDSGEGSPGQAAVRQRLADAQAELAMWQAQPPSVPGVLYAGDRIQVPQPTSGIPISIIGTGSNFVALSPNAPEDERLFGVDLLLTSAGDLVFEDNDLVVVRGLQNIATAQERYVRLPLGALPWAPGIGNFAWQDMNVWQGRGSNQMLAASLYLTLRQDPRVQKVKNVRAVTSAGKATLVYDLDLINGKTVPQMHGASIGAS